MAVGLALAAFALLVWRGHFVDSNPNAPLPATTSAQAPKPKRPQSAKRTQPPPARTAKSLTGTTAPQLVRVTIAASRGDCWVRAHKGSAAGPVIFERVLRQGETAMVRAPSVWLELGASGNVDVRVNGVARSIPTGTTNIGLG